MRMKVACLGKRVKMKRRGEGGVTLSGFDYY